MSLGPDARAEAGSPPTAIRESNRTGLQRDAHVGRRKLTRRQALATVYAQSQSRGRYPINRGRRAMQPLTECGWPKVPCVAGLKELEASNPRTMRHGAAIRRTRCTPNRNRSTGVPLASGDPCARVLCSTVPTALIRRSMPRQPPNLLLRGSILAHRPGTHHSTRWVIPSRSCPR